MTELMVIVAVIVLLILLRASAITSATNQTKRGQCASNLRQFALAMHIYAGENEDRLPSTGPQFWAFDLPADVGTFVESTGSKWTVMYCPGTAPRFDDTANFDLYNYSTGYRVVGYANAFPGSSVVSATNLNPTLTPVPIQVAFNVYVTPLASQRVLLADATLSQAGQNNSAQRYSYEYVNIQGGFSKAHVSAHLSGRFPAGGNLAMLDGHVEWRKFDDMTPRTQGSSPVFWW